MSSAKIESPRLFSEAVKCGTFEEEGYARGFHSVAGLDEVGRGPLAGPVVAAAVVLRRGFSCSDIKDSKLLTHSQRQKLAPMIKENAVSLGLGVVEVGEIDRINIFTASLRAMVKAYRALQPTADYILIDGNRIIPRDLLEPASLSLESLPRQRAIVKGDQLCISIAAASILAKVARDAMMLELDMLYPEYGFADHKGYGCPSHLETLRRLGPSPVHRLSFRPVRDAWAERAGSDTEPLLFER